MQVAEGSDLIESFLESENNKKKKDDTRMSNKNMRNSLRPVYERLTQTETLNVSF